MAEVCLADKKKGFGDALLDLFVVREEGDADKPASADSAPSADTSSPPAGDAAVVDDLIARYAKGDAAPNKSRSTRPPVAGKTAPSAPTDAGAAPKADGAAPAAATAPTTPPTPEPAQPVPNVQIDTAAVLRKAGLSAEDQDRVEKTLNLLHTLPMDTPIALKRQIVGASLQAFGIAVDQIVESALLHQSAFLRHQEEGDKGTQAQLQESSRRLADLEKEAARIKLQMNELRSQQQGLVFAVSRQKARLQGILEFFGNEAVERVQQTSVKLRSRGPEK